MQDLRDCFREHPVIASMRNDTDFKYALNSKVAALFILHGDIFNLPRNSCSLFYRTRIQKVALSSYCGRFDF